jgi:hypothetical protein
MEDSESAEKQENTGIVRIVSRMRRSASASEAVHR